MSKLVIVESPAKAKTIGRYLGKDYNVIASMGHVRDLPEKQLGVEVDKDFKPTYINIPGKSDLIKKIKRRAAKSDEIYLATDPDREGEAISWHLAHILKLDVDKANRVTFGEITRKGIENGMAARRSIDMNLVDAQQGRRVLDRLVGYKLSPFLWKAVAKNLSAGRVQSVAVKLVVERHREILRFVPDEFWTITATLSPAGSRKKFRAAYWGTGGKKFQPKTGEEAERIKSESEASEFVIDKITRGQKKKSPAPPFSTSTLQQEASRRLGFTARRTMRTAQNLYEGVTLKNRGTMGLITYMRTDSLRISDEAYFARKDYISENFGAEYLPARRRYFRSKAGAQDAHEAIRPTNITITPEEAAASLKSDERRLYRLIWERFTASQMADCIQETVNVDILAGRHLYKASGYTVVFPGYTALYEEASDEKKEKDTALPPMESDTRLKLRGIDCEQKFTQPPSEYTEATLIKAMEDNGIGRPSTYATTISAIIDRGYVSREERKLLPTGLGEAVTDLLDEKFPNVMDVKFTARMESDLDRVEDGNKEWTRVVRNFYDVFEDELEKANEDMKGRKIEVEKKSEDEPTDIICDKCGRPMVIKTGKYGRFLACTGFPACKNTMPIINYVRGECPRCGGRLKKLTSKKLHRTFYACDRPGCDFMSWEEPTELKCPSCGKTLFRKGPRGKAHCINEECSEYRPTVRFRKASGGKAARDE